MFEFEVRTEEKNLERSVLKKETVLFWMLRAACQRNDPCSIRRLIYSHHEILNAVTEDGTQSIHIAGLLGHHNIVKIMAEAGANVDAEFGENIYLRYVKNKQWCSDFGDKITLLIFAILSNNSHLAHVLIEHNANLNVKSLKNKTILMYALQNDCYSVAKEIISKVNDKKFINARDDDGYPTVYHLVHPDKYGLFRFTGTDLLTMHCEKGDVLKFLIDAGADIYASIDGYPKTQLINMAAYRGSYSMLKYLLPLYTSINDSIVFQNTVLPINGVFLFKSVPSVGRNFLENNLLRRLMVCYELIIKDIVNRLAFGLPVPEDEKKRLDSILQEETVLTLELTRNYEQRFIQGVLKNEMIYYDNKCITQYEFISQCVNDKKLLRLVRNEVLINAFTKTNIYSNNEEYEWFKVQLTVRIIKAQKRVKLLEELKKVAHLKNAILLPYECILEIIDYLNNEDLDTFINSFVIK